MRSAKTQRHKNGKRGRTFCKNGETLRSGNHAVMLDATILLGMDSSSDDQNSGSGATYKGSCGKGLLNRIEKRIAEQRTNCSILNMSSDSSEY